MVWDRWKKHAEDTPHREAIVHWTASEAPFRWPWGELVEQSMRLSAHLSQSGVGAGQVCGLIFRHHKFFYPLYMAVAALGAIPAVLAYPNNRLHPDKFRAGLEGMSRQSGLDWVLTERALEEAVAPLLTRAGTTVRGMLFPIDGASGSIDGRSLPPHPSCSPDSTCLLQHSSGTTGLQKGVALSHRAILEHVDRYGVSIDIRESDKIVSWLPLYHDMGLIAALYLPLTLGIPLVQLDPFEWVAAPIILLEAISKEAATLCWLPNFAYNLMADRIRDDDLEGVRLDTIRMLVNCSEPVRAESHERFYERFARLGLKRDALSACYAMAETTFAVTQSAPGREARQLDLDRDELAQHRVAPAGTATSPRCCVSSGMPIPGCQVKIIDESGVTQPEDQVGEIAIRSVSLFDGYRNNPEKTAEVLVDGWYLSGDYGFFHEEELYVIGRRKDVLIVAGKNIYPEDIEDVVTRVPGVLPGRVVAFGLDDERSGTEQVCVVLETAVETAPDRRRLRLAIIQAGMEIDVTIYRVYLAPPRWLIKSSAGKPSRQANKQRAAESLTHN
jgi:fatty-acyl-CoA synthase